MSFSFRRFSTLACAFCAVIYGTSVAAAANVYQTSTVKKILTGYSDKAVYFSMTDAALNPASCAVTSVYGIDPSSRDVQAMLAVLLTGKTSGNEVEIKVSGGECFGDYPSVKIVTLR